MQNYKFSKIISDDKWSGLSDKQKIKIFKNFFLDLEDFLVTKNKYHSSCQDSSTITSSFLEKFKLLKNENNDFLKKLYSDSLNIKTYEDIYNTLRKAYASDLSKQKDFHFLTNINVIKGDKKKSDVRKNPLILILDNLRSAFNVGSIIRISECLNLEEILFCGHTPLPEAEKVKNTAMGTEEMIKWQYFESTNDAIAYVKTKGHLVYALETTDNAKSIYDNKFEKRISLIVGNEALGISLETLSLCDKYVIIPLNGWKNSLNVATATAVCCFEVQRQWQYN